MPVFRRLLPGLALLLPVTVLAVQPAAAQDGKDPWRITLGAGAAWAPDYLGSDDYDVDPLPVVDIRYRDRFFLSSRDGLGFNASRLENLRFGPLVKYRTGRDQDDDDDLRGMGDIDPAGEAGVFAEYRMLPFTFGAELRQGFGGHEALVGDLKAAWVGKLTDKISFSIGPQLSFASSDFTETYFGVDAAQSARSGYRRYDADGWYYSYGLSGAITDRITDNITMAYFAGVSRIAGDAADSPLVDEAGDATQARLGITISYSFGF